MGRVAALVSFVVLMSGCITERSATFSSAPGPLPFSSELQKEPLDRRWAIGEIFVAAENGGPQQSTDNWTPARTQIEQRLGETLRRQASLGQRVEDRPSAELVVDVDVRIKETRAINGWFGPAILSEVAILGGGAATGAAIGSASTHGSAEGGALGGAIGVTAAIVPAILVPLLFPSMDVLQTADAKLSFRRASDGVVIYEKQTRAQWIDKHNAYGVEDKLARTTGSLAQELEKEIVTALYAGLRASPGTQAIAQEKRDGPALFVADAPRAIRFLP